MRRGIVIGMVVALLFLLGMPPAMANEPGTDDTTKNDEHQASLGVGSVTTGLPVLGSQLTVTVTVGDNGAIQSVSLDRAADPVEEGEHRVVYELATGGTFVLVKAGPHRVTTRVRSDGADDVTGPGQWSADVFGNGDVVISYVIGTDADGNPTVSIAGVSPPTGVEASTGDPRTYSSDRGAKAKVVVTLTSGDDTARLFFTVSTRQKEDGSVKVSLAVTLTNWRGHWFHHAGWKDGRHDGDHARSGQQRNARASTDGGKVSHDARNGHHDRPDGRDGRGDGHRGERSHSKSDG
jgi:hypothetical protein